MTIYLLTLLWTIGIELAIVTAVRHFVLKLRAKPLLATCVCINLLSHPAATLAHLELSAPILLVEMAVIVVETMGYRYVGGIPAKWSMALALVTNAASMSVGFLTQ